MDALILCVFICSIYILQGKLDSLAFTDFNPKCPEYLQLEQRYKYSGDFSTLLLTTDNSITIK